MNVLKIENTPSAAEGMYKAACSRVMLNQSQSCLEMAAAAMCISPAFAPDAGSDYRL
jgi:hypothetical protein